MLALLAAVTIVGIAAVVCGFYFGHPGDTTASTVASVRDGETRRSAALPAGNGMPVVRIEPIRVIGTPSSDSVAAERLRAKIGDAFARFDTINVASGPALASAAAPMPMPHTDYILSGSLEYTGNAANAWFTLTSVAEGKVVWSRTFERIQSPGGTGVTEELGRHRAHQLAAAILRRHPRARPCQPACIECRRPALSMHPGGRGLDAEVRPPVARHGPQLPRAFDGARPELRGGLHVPGLDLQSRIPARLRSASGGSAARSRAARGAPGDPAAIRKARAPIWR